MDFKNKKKKKITGTKTAADVKKTAQFCEMKKEKQTERDSIRKQK